MAPKPETLTRIIEETPGKETQGIYGMSSVVVDVDPGSEGSVDFVPLVPVAILSGMMQLKGTHDGDVVNLDVDPQRAVGVLDQTVPSGVTTLSLPSGVVALFENKTLYLGHDLLLDDGAVADLGPVVGYDVGAQTVDVANPTPRAFSVGDVVRYTASMTPGVLGGRGVELKGSEHGIFQVGQDKIGGTRIDAGQTVRFRYKNTGPSGVRAVLSFGLLY